MRGFLKGLRQNILVFIDEAYYEYVYDRDYANSLKLIKLHKNIFVTRTFSKMYGLAGLRIGYGFGDPEVAEAWTAPVKLSRAQREKLVDTLTLRLFKYYQSLPPDAQKYNPFRDGIPNLPDGHNKALNSERGQAVGMILNPSTTEVMSWLRKFVGARAQLVNKKEGYGGIADVALRISRNPV